MVGTGSHASHCCLKFCHDCMPLQVMIGRGLSAGVAAQQALPPQPAAKLIQSLLAFKATLSNFDAIASSQQWQGWSVSSNSDLCSWSNAVCTEQVFTGLAFSNVSLEGMMALMPIVRQHTASVR